VSLAVREFGITLDRAAGPADSRSGAGVHPAWTPGGRAAYLKVTPASLGAGALDGARGELRFYRQLAAGVPVRTPPLLNALETGSGVALLLAAAGEQVSAGAWMGPAWAALGRDLAGLHAVPMAGRDWPRPNPLLEAMSEPVPGEITRFWGDVLPWLPGLLGARDELRAELAAQPAVLVHGDCHTGNIVHAADGPVFCDWQSTGAGRATSDLAHLHVRAAPAGVTVPHELTTAYLERSGGDPAALKRALLLEELAVFVFLWPPFAAYNSRAGIERVHDRARHLAAGWSAMTSHGHLPA
jgi:Ser/Thr protein kinase RdoA (MazF antagonist)